MEDFDYTLVIEFERFSDKDLQEVIKILYYGSSECYIDLEYLADEVIRRQNECQYDIRDWRNKPLKELIHSIFETLKKISRFMEEPSSRIQIIHDNYKKYMYGIDSPVASPVVSPTSSEVKVPKIMKKQKGKRKEKR